MRNHCPGLAAALAFFAASVASASAAGQEAAPVTPYRPSVSSPAQLPAPGQLEFEAGLLGARSDGAWRDSVPVLFKLAFSEQWGLLAGGDAWVSAIGDAGARLRGLGDTSIVAKRAFIVDNSTAFGLELGAKLPTARNGIGSGKADWSINTIYSQDLGQVHMDANANLTQLGAPEAGTGHRQGGLSASFSAPVTEQWAATAELSGTCRAGTGSTAQLLLAAAWSPSKQMTIDVGLAHGLNPASAQWSLFGGVVLPVARLW